MFYLTESDMILKIMKKRRQVGLHVPWAAPLFGLERTTSTGDSVRVRVPNN